MSLTEQITEVTLKARLTDYDQRSALGMARSWIDNQEPIRWNPDQIEYKRRDQLAKDLVALLESSPTDRSEGIEALQAARKAVNAPFLNPEMLGFQARRAELLKPGERRKRTEAKAGK